jgi:hypothetical protein
LTVYKGGYGGEGVPIGGYDPMPGGAIGIPSSYINFLKELKMVGDSGILLYGMYQVISIINNISNNSTFFNCIELKEHGEMR